MKKENADLLLNLDTDKFVAEWVQEIERLQVRKERLQDRIERTEAEIVSIDGELSNAKAEKKQWKRLATERRKLLAELAGGEPSRA